MSKITELAESVPSEVSLPSVQTATLSPDIIVILGRASKYGCGGVCNHCIITLSTKATNPAPNLVTVCLNNIGYSDLGPKNFVHCLFSSYLRLSKVSICKVQTGLGG